MTNAGIVDDAVEAAVTGGGLGDHGVNLLALRDIGGKIDGLLDAVIQRAKTDGVRTVMCNGEVIYDNGRFTRVDRENALKTLHDELQHALSDDEVERRNLSKALLPHVKRFYTGYVDPAKHEPFYRQSSRI